MSLIYEDLYQFSSYVVPINLSFHQYLILADESILVHTGNMQQAELLIPQLKAVLGDKKLKYIFISHFEADECGGLSVILKHFPEAKPICSEVTARQLIGFKITDNAVVKKPGEKLNLGSHELEFISYPSEIHLWEGLLLMENKNGIFFSSDLLFSLGEASGSVIEGNWNKEVDGITSEQISDPERKAKLKQTLTQLDPKFAAVGHGSCFKF